MGTHFAPSYANLFMGYFESTFIMNNTAWSNKIILYKRNIDEHVFMETDFESFYKYLNNNEWGISLMGENIMNSM